MMTQHSQEMLNLVTKALIGLVKQIKAIRYYPPKHPALQAAAEDCLRGFRPVLSGGFPLPLMVRKNGFFWDEIPVATNNQILSQLSKFCFAKRIQYLTIMPDLNSRDLQYFVHYLQLDSQFIQRHGGIQAILEMARLKTIWVNVHDLNEILERRESLEELPDEMDLGPDELLQQADLLSGEQPQPEELTLEMLVAKLEREPQDSKFHQLLQELIPMVRMQLDETNRNLVMRAFWLLCHAATARKSSSARKESARAALADLSGDEVVNFLISTLLDANTDQKTQELLTKILAYMGPHVGQRVMQILCDEESSYKRKLISNILARSGSCVLPIVHKCVDDDRWYVVRNAVILMGDIRSQESLGKLALLLNHEDFRVRRETIRALTKIGGDEGIEMLLKAAESDDFEMRRRAILSLGAMHATTAVPTLMSILKSLRWNQRDIDLKKDTIRALGEISSPEAIPELILILNRKRLIRRQLNEELRAAAAEALGDIADESTRPILTEALNDRNANVARAAAQALKHLDKDER